MKSARGVLVSITGGKGLTLYDVDEAASRIHQEVGEEANIIIGATFEPALDDSVQVSVVATGIDQAANSQIDPMSDRSRAEPVFRAVSSSGHPISGDDEAAQACGREPPANFAFNSSSSAARKARHHRLRQAGCASIRLALIAARSTPYR